MSQNLINKAKQPIRCISCGKVIGQGFIVEGSIQLQCKCGVKTKIEAEKKPEGRPTEVHIPYGAVDNLWMS